MIEADTRQTILVVDDNAENIDLMVEILSPFYIVKAARSGERALRIAEASRQPDLILLDVMMPEMDGYEVCRRLKDNVTTRHIPVVFLTAMSTVEDERKGFELGAVDYITKPISPPIVLARTRTQLSLYDQKRTLEDAVRQRTAELKETQLEVIRRLGRAAEFKDNDTGLHVIRMSHYAQLIGQAMGLPGEIVDLIFHAAPMHDIGKIGIPDSVLTKPGPLNDEEWVQMKLHPTIGAEIIGDHRSSLLTMARVIAMTHHEKWDGSGYPRGLSGKDINIAGRIVAVADVFDALANDRPYKKAWPMPEAVAQIKAGSGSHFDPDAVAAFLSVLPQVQDISRGYCEQESNRD